MASETKIPTTVITGFLGAGKTTLVRHLIANADRRIALIINEFGDVGVDGELLKGCANEACGDGDIVELANGCICCTVADDFVPAMTALIEREQPPEHIVIETSGLALPQPLVRAFNWPEIRTRVTVDGVVTVVDGEALAQGRVTGDLNALHAQRAEDEALDHDDPVEEVFEDQLAAADIVVMTKIDLIDGGAHDRAKAHLNGAVRPGVKVVTSANGAVSDSVLIGLGASAEGDLASRTGHHDEEDEHDHDDFETCAIELAPFSSREALEAAATRAIAGTALLRLKGFAAIEGRDMRLVLQAVGPRIETWFDRDFEIGEPRRTRLVAIGLKGLDAAGIQAALTEN
ncbi:MAG: cobalamin biosynthesis protein CobW [Rhizobiales bacterium]|nr:cobalamin biosynthesis protein CobW [Hyphomicrobiales bacterium]